VVVGIDTIVLFDKCDDLGIGQVLVIEVAVIGQDEVIIPIRVKVVPALKVCGFVLGSEESVAGAEGAGGEVVRLGVDVRVDAEAEGLGRGGRGHGGGIVEVRKRTCVAHWWENTLKWLVLETFCVDLGAAHGNGGARAESVVGLGLAGHVHGVPDCLWVCSMVLLDMFGPRHLVGEGGVAEEAGVLVDDLGGVELGHVDEVVVEMVQLVVKICENHRESGSARLGN
jgi:hypothetical protein